MRWNILLILLTGFAALHAADLGLSIVNQSGYADNIFANYSQRPDAYSRTSGYLNSDWIGERDGLRLFTEATWTAFRTYGERSSLRHALGLAIYRNLSAKGDRVRAGLEWRRTNYGEEYEWYDAHEWYGYGNVRIVAADQLYFYGGGQIRRKDYARLAPFSHWTGSAYAQLSRFFDSGTTLMLEIDVLFKSYDAADETSGIAELPEIVTLGTGTGEQLYLRLRAAQAVTSVTGLSLQWSRRMTLHNSVRYLGTGSGFYYSDEALFDDVFGYQSSEVTLELKQRLPWRLQCTLGGGMMNKNYTDRLALDIDGVPFPDQRLRRDTRFSIWSSLSRRIAIDRDSLSLLLSLDAYRIDNASNDPYYDYGSGGISLGLSLDF